MTVSEQPLHGVAGGSGRTLFSLPLFFSFFACFTLLCVAAQVFEGGYLADRGNHADEAAHFVSSLAISKYLASGASTNPFDFIKSFYNHFPKVAIGHWPPVFEVVQAFVFLVVGKPAISAIALQAVIAGACLAIPATIVSGMVGIFGGTSSGLVLFFSPVFFPMLDMVMADIFVALNVTLTALAWSRFYYTKTWKSAALFGFAAAISILTKGSAFGLALLPILYLSINRDLRFLVDKRTLFAGTVTGLLTLPWYFLTYKMAADGFVYQWGWSYVSVALPFFLKHLNYALGPIVCISYVLGSIAVILKPSFPSTRNIKVDATSLAMLLFSLVVPADLDARYLIPIFPSVVIVATVAISEVSSYARVHWGKRASRLIIALIFMSCTPLLFSQAHIKSFGSEKLVNFILSSEKVDNFVLVSGSVKAEGAFISSFATSPDGGAFYIVRAQKALATTNWMATSYELKYPTVEKLAEWIKSSQIGWLAIDYDNSQLDFEHNKLLKEAIERGLIQAKLELVSPHPGGEMRLYYLPEAAMTPDKVHELMAIQQPGHL
jgi:hypothetical protein